MQKKHFIGIDVSKHTLDACFIIREQESFSQPVWKQFANTSAGLKGLQGWLGAAKVPLSEETIIVIENTGLYHRLT